MKPAVFRLVLASALFAGWIGYLGYQVWYRPVRENGQPLVLSRPQILASELDVIATVPDKSGHEVTIVSVLYPSDSILTPGTTIQVTNIGDCAPVPMGGDSPLPPADWSGPGDYLLPLRALPEKNKYEVVPIPPSPGFYLSRIDEPPPRLYPDTAQTRAQYHQIKPSAP
jgi:hypothetical protein